MIIELDMNSSIPIYVQLRNQIVMGIGHGELKPGESLPTVRQLAEDAGERYGICAVPPHRPLSSG